MPSTSGQRPRPGCGRAGSGYGGALLERSDKQPWFLARTPDGESLCISGSLAGGEASESEIRRTSAARFGTATLTRLLVLWQRTPSGEPGGTARGSAVADNVGSF